MVEGDAYWTQPNTQNGILYIQVQGKTIRSAELYQEETLPDAKREALQTNQWVRSDEEPPPWLKISHDPPETQTIKIGKSIHTPLSALPESPDSVPAAESGVPSFSPGY